VLMNLWNGWDHVMHTDKHQPMRLRGGHHQSLDRFLCHDFHDVGRCEECPGGYDWKSIRSRCLKLSSRLLSNVGGRILGVMNALLHMLFYSMVVGQCSRPNHTCDAWELSDRCFAAAAPASGTSRKNLIGEILVLWCTSQICVIESFFVAHQEGCAKKIAYFCDALLNHAPQK
jgi:hypothetical protein